jgi:hypothetical protein
VRSGLLACTVLAALAASAGAAGGPAAAIAPCTGPQLTGSFTAVRGSGAAGHISYALRLTNRSTRACFVSGLPRLRLVGTGGRLLPTHVTPAFRGGLTAVRVVLGPGGRAKATARFSPDVPGTGEPVSGRLCEPTAYRLRVTPPPGGGTVSVPVRPPTPVCEHGRIELTALSPTS